MLMRPEATSQLLEIPDGAAGTDATLDLMARIVRAYRVNPDIRDTARAIISVAPPKAYAQEARLLYSYVRDEIRYTRDVNGVETIQTPDNTIAFSAGDCDDMAVLLASLLESVGHPTRFFAAGFDGDPISHVWTETLIGSRWFAMDPTESDLDFGQRPAGITDKIIWNV